MKLREHQRPLSDRAIAIGAVIVLGIVVTAWILLLWHYGGEKPSVKLDAIRTASAITVTVGGAAALLLAARRQRSTELTLEHQREVARATEQDAEERRLTELYIRAVDQLGHGQAPVRFGGLHALERLAQNSQGQRQTIVDVICSYLRMPYAPPGDQVLGEDALGDMYRRYEECCQELQVRLTAQRILVAHLRPEAATVFWDDIDLNLTGAYLHEFDLSACHVRKVQFDGVMFAGQAKFDGARFVENAGFCRTRFAGEVGFYGAQFTKDAVFDEARFAKDARFTKATFSRYVGFEDARFAGDALFIEVEFRHAAFNRAWFAERALFREAQFTGYAWFFEARFRHAGFEDAQFAAYGWFDGAQFTGYAWFHEEQFSKGVGFNGARVASSAGHVVLPAGWTTRAAQPAEGEEEGWLYVVRDEDSSEQPAEAPDNRGGQSSSEAGT